MNIDEKMSCYPLWDEYHQMDITEEEVIDALRYISSHKAQGPDNIHNQMIKNSGQALIHSLVRSDMFQDYGKEQILFRSQNQIETIAFARITGNLIIIWSWEIIGRLMWCLNESKLLQQC
ncbi:hypothetical protein RFI_28427 [Reticulomyxa filosa]|uniref:Uncharacterized protein n=1 Tax=Reticulomyxa filosa TaxID=46433 RepID=X6M4Y4_RETFI|nr:hypothetical protein RFI_28427 [Reticulomyxa filosa]|eukprot:ETO08959.1 hypothetical protein RFI_28427 [Reticulomyxa filosa]